MTFRSRLADAGLSIEEDKGEDDMKCPKCGIEMQKKSKDQWICRNPRCSEHKEEKK